MVIDSSALIAIHLKEQGCESIFSKIADASISVVGAPTLLETVS